MKSTPGRTLPQGPPLREASTVGLRGCCSTSFLVKKINSCRNSATTGSYAFLEGVPREGLEPSTVGLRGRCSTIELPRREKAG